MYKYHKKLISLFYCNLRKLTLLSVETIVVNKTDIYTFVYQFLFLKLICSYNVKIRLLLNKTNFRRIIEFFFVDILNAHISYIFFFA